MKEAALGKREWEWGGETEEVIIFQRIMMEFLEGLEIKKKFYHF